METSTRSSRNPRQAQQQNPAHFTPSLPESNMDSIRPGELNVSHGSPAASRTPNRGGKAIRRFNPEPVESSKITRRPPPPPSKEDGDDDDAGGRLTIRLPSSSSRPAPRKFPPQLIETASRSVHSREPIPRTDVGGSRPNASYRSSRSSRTPDETFLPMTSHPGMLTEVDYAAVSRPPPESRFSYENLVKRATQRSHSFRIPDLPSIPSNSSQNSDVPSLSTSPSISSDEDRKQAKVKSRHRESCDERFSDYLLSLAARPTEKQLQEQALAAFPNEQVYNPVSHFAIDKEDDDIENEDQSIDPTYPSFQHDDSYSFRRESIADLPYELERMRRYKEDAEVRASSGGSSTGETLRASHCSNPMARHSAAKVNHVTNTTLLIGGWQADVELGPMRQAASPPMLGGDIVFPFSLSPQGTRCETGLLSPSPSCSEFADNKQNSNLWLGNPQIETENTCGLWRGLCQKAYMIEEHGPRLRSGIVTPSPEVDGDSYLTLRVPETPHSAYQLLPTPPEDPVSLERMDSILEVEQTIAEEFHDDFVTQVYNYLSLGYPSLAWPYDQELSKISGIPVSELRSDDLRTDAKGYVGAPEGIGVSQDGVTTGQCSRWLALRLYIREWARQQPGMARSDKTLETWGLRERRGSWAI
jgi:hypothetical protein